MSSAADLDGSDPLRHWRDSFHLPGGGETLYLCGHSLGLQPKAAKRYIQEELAAWAELGVEAHFRPEASWVGYPDRLRHAMARIVGAKASEVVLMNALTVNLHLMLTSFYRPSRTRRRILIEDKAFPSDRYAIDSHVRWHGFDPRDTVLVARPRAGESIVREDDLEHTIRQEGDSIALVFLGGVQYHTGQVFDMENIAAAARARGCIVGFDLAHAAGNVPLELHQWGVDFAVWCTYKYLNSGPGAVGGCFVHEDRWADERPRLAGWWGQRPDTRFAMPDTFDPAKGADAWQVSNPPILQMAALRASLEIFEEVGMQAIRAKSIRLLEYFDELTAEIRGPEFQVITAADRGAQASVLFGSRATAVLAALRENGVVCDVRGPAVRVSFVPLYNGFGDVRRFVEAAKSALRT